MIPTYRELLFPTLEAVRALGGSGRIDEITEKAIDFGGFAEEQQAILHREGPGTELEYRIAWARTILKRIGALENSVRGVWSTTDLGRTLTETELDRRYREVRAAQAATARERQRPEGDEPSEGVADDWKERLLHVLLDLAPDRFERLARRLLREAGFTSVVVTGRTGDGGIDGHGVYAISEQHQLLSFPVFFQCKRYRGSVGPGAVRDFRGAMAGRGDKGLLITTGTFTADAKREATREGTSPIDLISGDRLCELLKDFGLGVKTEKIEMVTVEASAFDEI